jgi:hypothetical protein
MKARFFVSALLLALSISIFALPAAAIPHVHLGGVSVGVGYSHFSGPYYPYQYWGPYPPGFYPGYYGYDPFWYPSPMAYGVRGADKGEVHLKDAAPQAEVYIDGAYAGLVKDLRTLWLSPGAYNVEVRASAQNPVQKRIYVLTGKTLNVRMAEVKQ